MFKKRLWKRILIVLGFLAVLLVCGAFYLNWMMKQPLYRFGSVRTQVNLTGPLQPPEQEDEHSWQVEEDLSLSFDAYGEGRPVVVVHGGPGIPYASEWMGLAPLKDRYRFYYYHQRGCGASTRPFDKFEGNFYENMTTLESKLGLGAQIADIERIRRILKQDKLILVGHSYGGFIAAMYAAEFPARVERLVLVAPAGVLTPPDADRDLFARARAKLAADKRADYDALVAEYLDFGDLFSKSDSDLVDLQNRMGEFLLPAMGYDASQVPEDAPRSGGWAVFALYFSNGLAQDFRPAIKQITAPAMIVHGADDTLALAGSRTYESIPNSEFVLVSSEDSMGHAGHMVFDDCPTKFAQQVEQFLAPK